MAPGLGGGANWPGGAADPETGFVYVGSTTTPGVSDLTRTPTTRSRAVDTDYTFGGTLPTIQGLRLIKPPYGRITAYDMTALARAADAATQRALFEYQTDKGLTATGNLDYRTARSLGLVTSGGGVGTGIGGGSSYGATL